MTYVNNHLPDAGKTLLPSRWQGFLCFDFIPQIKRRDVHGHGLAQIAIARSLFIFFLFIQIQYFILDPIRYIGELEPKFAGVELTSMMLNECVEKSSYMKSNDWRSTPGRAFVLVAHSHIGLKPTSNISATLNLSDTRTQAQMESERFLLL